MPAKDAIHDAVKNALVKDGWTITDDPYIVHYAELDLYADMAAERPFAAARAGRKIVVEAKSFGGLSSIQELKLAVGQYLVYKGYLGVSAPDYKIYMAVPKSTFERFFALEAVRFITKLYDVHILVVNIDTEEVDQWTS